MRLTVLGACGAWPEAGQACSGYLVEQDGFRLLVDLGYATVPRLLERVTEEQVDAVFISHGHPDHCADLNPLLRAVISVNSGAGREAAASDRVRGDSAARGPLEGIPVLVKDNVAARGMPATAGSPALLDAEFRPIMKGGMPVISGVGSTAVRDALTKYQPMLSLHGHIHESRGEARIGRTLAINPGSEYSEGVLRGAIITLSRKKGVRGYQLVAG